VVQKRFERIFARIDESNRVHQPPWVERVLGVIFRWIRRGDYQNAHLDYRALVEGFKGQREYFIKADNRDDAEPTRSELFVRVFLLLGIAIAIASIFVLHDLDEWGEGLLLVAAGLAPVTAALIHNYAEKQALAEHIKQYERMSILFANAEKRLDESIHAGDSTLARNQLRDLGKEALNESADWVLLHRERPLEVPSAG
jgi:hypothetical protein